MQVRVFESPDMTSGLKLVRKELGPDALILSTKTVRNGKLGLLGKPTIEITAAIDTPWPKEQENQAARKTGHDNQKSRAAGTQETQRGKSVHTTVGGDDITLDYSPGAIDALERKEAGTMLTAQKPSPPSDDALRSEVNELKSLVSELAGKLTQPPSYDGEQPPREQSHGQSSTGNSLRNRLTTMKQTIDPVTSLLEDSGIDAATTRTISEFALEHLNACDIADNGKLRRFIIQAMESLLEVKSPGFNAENKQQRIALIGPTGVGKTTTLAKLAAHYLSNHSNSVALITIDTYRIAAVEQLKVYGEIMYLPVDVVISPEQLESALERHRDKELVLIDTAGRSPRDALCIQELSTFLRPDLNIEKHLVLSATTRESELKETIQHFSKVGIDRTIFTKIDECSRNGVILNVQVHNDAPLSYITNGQRVPEDLLQITRRSVAELIMSHPEGNSHV